MRSWTAVPRSAREYIAGWRTPSVARLTGAGILVAAIIASIAVGFAQTYVLTLAVQTLVLVLLSIGWNMSASAGLESFGHTSFFGFGAYTVALLLLHTNLPMPVNMLISAAVGMALAVVLIPTFRVSGLFFSILTLSLGVAFGLVGQWVLPSGQNGLFYRAVFGVDVLSAYYFALAVCAIVLIIVAIIKATKLGSALELAGSDAQLAEAVGVNTFAVKAIYWTIGGGFAGMAGGLFAANALVITPDTVFNINYSIIPVLAVILGGVGTFWGPVLGAIVYSAISYVINSWAGSNGSIALLINGAILVLLATLLPKGLLGLVNRSRRARRQVVGESRDAAVVGASEK